MSTTFEPPVTHPVSDAVDTLTGALDELLGAQLWTMPERDLLAARIALEAQAARLTACRWALTREIDARGAAVSAGATSTTAWLVSRLRQAPSEAARELRMSARVHPDGLPSVHAALAAGTITATAATVITDTDRVLSAMPPRTSAPTRNRP
jgi:hypothetical protein